MHYSKPLDLYLAFHGIKNNVNRSEITSNWVDESAAYEWRVRLFGVSHLSWIFWGFEKNSAVESVTDYTGTQ